MQKTKAKVMRLKQPDTSSNPKGETASFVVGPDVIQLRRPLTKGIIHRLRQRLKQPLQQKI